MFILPIFQHPEIGVVNKEIAIKIQDLLELLPAGLFYIQTFLLRRVKLIFEWKEIIKNLPIIIALPDT
jgi:hypothetical protein